MNKVKITLTFKLLLELDLYDATDAVKCLLNHENTNERAYA